MSFPDLDQAIARIPDGKWAVAVSGGADSVALLTLLARRGGLALHVVHLDHELRGEESRRDAEFVSELATSMALTCTIRRRSEIEPTIVERPANVESLGRVCRQALFRRVVHEHQLDGVI